MGHHTAKEDCEGVAPPHPLHASIDRSWDRKTLVLDDVWEKSCAKTFTIWQRKKKFARYAVCDGESAILLFKRAELTSNRIAGTGED